MDPEVGFEPTTFSLWGWLATSATLRYIYKARLSWEDLVGNRVSINICCLSLLMVIPRGVEPRSWEWKSHVLTTRLRDHFLWIHSVELSDTTWRRILCRQLSIRWRAKGSNKKEKHIKAPYDYTCALPAKLLPTYLGGKVGLEPTTSSSQKSNRDCC